MSRRRRAFGTTRQLMERMDHDLLFRWFVDLGVDDPAWVPTVFTKNRDQLPTTDMSRKSLPRT